MIFFRLVKLFCHSSLCSSILNCIIFYVLLLLNTITLSFKSFVNWPKRGTIINLCIAVRQIISLTSIRATFLNYSVWIYFLLWHCSELIKSSLCRVDHWPQQEAQTIAIESTLFTFIFNVSTKNTFLSSFFLSPSQSSAIFPSQQESWSTGVETVLTLMLCPVYDWSDLLMLFHAKSSRITLPPLPPPLWSLQHSYSAVLDE